tara:strand:+ start:9680 stop:10441 length:762 start_codon:yes stop_codon:yes gene_type:complete
MLGKYTIYDIKYRLNKLKCCFAEKTAKLVDKQKYGKPCADEKCNVQLMGAYIEMLECLVSEGCDCSAEWVSDGSIIYDSTANYVKDQVIKVYPRAAAVGTDEFLYMRWLSTIGSSFDILTLENGIQTIVPVTCNSNQQCPGDTLTPEETAEGFSHPCWKTINQNGWSVCGNLKIAWQARGSLIWTPGVTYLDGDIVKFNGGGNGSDQSGTNEFYICEVGSVSAYEFHEAIVSSTISGNKCNAWTKLACYDLIK